MKLKISVVVSLLIFWSLFTAIVIAGLLSKDAKQLASNNSPETVSNGQTQITLSVGEVDKHNTVSDCWMIISGKVYDVSGYLRIHPGGASTITPYCGQDGTQAFASKGGTGSHSPFAYSSLANYLVGTINQSVGVTAIQNTQSVTPSVSQRRSDDD